MQQINQNGFYWFSLRWDAAHSVAANQSVPNRTWFVDLSEYLFPCLPLKIQTNKPAPNFISVTFLNTGTVNVSAASGAYETRRAPPGFNCWHQLLTPPPTTTTTTAAATVHKVHCCTLIVLKLILLQSHRNTHWAKKWTLTNRYAATRGFITQCGSAFEGRPTLLFIL